MPVVGFDKVFAEEIAAINLRRDRQAPPRPHATLELEEEDKDPEGHPVVRPTAGSDLVGLSLSGGGVRSASFCLGALQALDELSVLQKVDYLSTVSGGGYIATSMTAAMSQSQDSKFPFPSELTPEERPALRHVRDHSNYLFPHGKIDVLSNFAIYLRGLIANALLLLPYLLGGAAITVALYRTVDSLSQRGTFSPFGVTQFGATLTMALLIAALLVLWALYRSFSAGKPDVGALPTILVALALLALPIMAIYEVHPRVLSRMFSSAAEASADGTKASAFINWVTFIGTIVAAFGVAAGFLSTFLASLLKKGTESPTLQAWLGKIFAKSAMYLAAASLPLVLWLAYLYLSYWGICEADCATTAKYRAPAWLAAILQSGHAHFGSYGTPHWLYFYGAGTFFLVQLFLMPNANSLHRLYRDRLSKAFLFDPRAPVATGLKARIQGLLQWLKTKLGPNEYKSTSRSLPPLDDIKFSDIRCEYSPYHIINAALNIRGSKYANQRGRNADFFVFTSKFTGSRATGYIRTAEVEKQVKGLDLATAMAISGAAASSNMGANTNKMLSPTLAILNIRLGFWLPNPRAIATGALRSTWAKIIDQLYFLREMVGRLSENSDLIYLTDGGHIENLGIYELLRRRCKLIIAIDAEADPQMSFNSLIALQRHALIDLGTLVSLPWSEIRNATGVAAKDIAETGGLAWNRAPQGPHAALGTIQYPGKRTGVLLYIKSSVTGDENDYIVDYMRRNPDFPHETTADQLFSEEQFEVYRALGFHATRRALKGEDKVAMAKGPAKWTGRVRRDPLVKTVSDLLF
jgi:hypothetical protein